MFKRLATSKLGKFLKLDNLYYNNPNLNRTYGFKTKQNTQDWAHYVHKAQPIFARAFDFWDASARTIMAYYHPFQHANIFKVAEAIAADGIHIVKKEDKDEEEPEDMKITQNKWERNQGDLLLKKSIEKWRMQGLILYVPYKKKYLGDYWTGPPWKVYGLDEFQIIDWDQYGHPIEFHVQPTNKKIDSFEIKIQDCVFFDPHLTDDYDGLPETAAAWDSMVDWLFEHESMTGFDQRLANGFMVLPTMLGTSDEVKSAYQSKMQNVRTEMGLIWEVDPDIEGFKPEWMDISGSGNFPEHLNKLEEAIATAIGFPARWLKGMEAGALSAAGEDRNQVYSKLKAIFKTCERFVIAVLKHHKWVASAENIAVKHGFQMELSDEEKANIDNIKATTIGLSTWLTINEMRERDGLPSIEGGDEMFAEQNNDAENQKDIDDNSSDNSMKEEKAKPKPEAKSDASNRAYINFLNMGPDATYKILKSMDKSILRADWGVKGRSQGDLVGQIMKQIQRTYATTLLGATKKQMEQEAKNQPNWNKWLKYTIKWDSVPNDPKPIIRKYFQNTPVREAAEFLGMSTGYVSKVRSKFDHESPKPHEDILALKTDSIQIDENTWEFEGPFVAPIEAEYSGILNKRHPDQIAEWYKSATPKEFYLGVNNDDSHSSPIKAEVLRDNAVGMVKAINLTPDGQVIGKYRIQMDKVKERLGDDNWVLDYAKQKKSLPVSVALWSRDVDKGDYVENTELDVRSVVLTRHPRNKWTVAQ